VTLTTREACAGETSGRMRTVLIAGLAIVIIGKVILLGIWGLA
jgi:hypothetical protein